MKAVALVTLMLIAALIGAAHAQYGQPRPPFGSDADVNAAHSLWWALRKAKLVGANAICGTPYKGTYPHDVVLTTLDAVVNVSGHEGVVIVKNNYGEREVSARAVANDPGRYLQAITVMFKRESAYDSDNKDWFWVTYGPDGEILKSPQGKPLAGRAAKSETGTGCIACHHGAPGGDYVFSHDRYSR